MAERTPLTRPHDEELNINEVSDQSGSIFHNKKLIALIVVALVALAAVIAAIVLLVIWDSDDDNETTDVYAVISAANIQLHLSGLFATANDLTNSSVKSRSVRNGYNASAAYIMDQLAKQSGFCEVQTQHFVVPVYQELAQPMLALAAIGNDPGLAPFSYQYGVDFMGMRYGGNGTFDLKMANVTIVSNLGCDSSDYAAVTPQSIALIQRGGSCTFYNKAIFAQNSNAAAILFYNPIGTSTITSSRIIDPTWVPSDPIVQIPSLGVSYSVGTTLISLSEQSFVQLNLSVQAQVTIDHTFNVFCTTKTGDAKNIVMAGAHLDSVPEGPGINDNGSGSSSVLEIAIQMSRLGIKPVNQIVFAWWGAEELGLLGSRYFVRNIINTTMEENIVAYINFDMLGSPNFVPQIHDASTAPINVQNSSRAIQLLFEDFFNNTLEKPYELTGMGGGSDYYPFILYTNIASGGLATGASQIKTMEQRSVFGGIANAQLDTCYHLPCDTPENVNAVVLQDMAQAAAYTIQTLAFEKDVRKYIYGA